MDERFEEAVGLAMSASIAAAKSATANNALGDGELLKLVIELFKTLLPILLEMLKDD